MSAPSGPGVGKQVLTLLTGTTMVQALGILVSPIVARQYGPTALGHLTAAGVFASMIATIAPLALDAAIVIVEKDDEASEIGGFVVTSSVVVGLISVGLVMLVSGLGASWESLKFVNTNPLFWACFVGATTVLTCSTAAISSLAVRHQQFSSVSSSRVVQSVATQGLTLGLGLWSPSDLAAASSLLVGQTLGLGVLAMALRGSSKPVRLAVPSIEGMKQIISTHRRFPLYTYPHAILDSMRENAIVAAMGAAGGELGLGYWGLVARTVRGPVSLLGSAFAQVFTSRVSQQAREGKPLEPIMRWVLVRLAAAALLGTVTLVLFGPQLFGLVFGSQWTEAGSVARLAVPWIAVNLVASPFAYLSYLLKINRPYLLWAIFYDLSLIAVASFAPSMFGFKGVVGAICGVGAAIMIAILTWQYRAGQRHDRSLPPALTPAVPA